MDFKQVKAYDLCIGFPHNPEETPIKYSVENLKSLCLSCIMDGYRGIAINIEKTGILTEKDKSNLVPFDIDELLTELPRNLFQVDTLSNDYTYFKQYSRITFQLTDNKQTHQLIEPNNKIPKTYDIIAIRPSTEKLFNTACTQIDKMPFYIKKEGITEALNRGIFFELCYCECLLDPSKRKYFLQNSLSIIKATKGKNIILSSNTWDMIFHRSPYDLIQITSLFGLNKASGCKLIEENCETVLKHAKNRKMIKGIVKVCTKEELMEEAKHQFGEDIQLYEKAVGFMDEEIKE